MGKKGDKVELRIADDRDSEIARNSSVEWALARLRELRRPLPPGFKFDRIEANER
jgi:antitoxin MazE